MPSNRAVGTISFGNYVTLRFQVVNIEEAEMPLPHWERGEGPASTGRFLVLFSFFRGYISFGSLWPFDQLRTGEFAPPRAQRAFRSEAYKKAVRLKHTMIRKPVDLFIHHLHP